MLLEAIARSFRDGNDPWRLVFVTSPTEAFTNVLGAPASANSILAAYTQGERTLRTCVYSPGLKLPGFGSQSMVVELPQDRAKWKAIYEEIIAPTLAIKGAKVTVLAPAESPV